jgi:BirA family biotin operon repressor/biotin-[acetyl-CoA-carboxylase] ligase
VRRPLKPRPGAGALGGPLVHIDVVGSTNDRARELAQAGAPGGTVVVAEQQTAGRGRQGRTWSSPRGRSLTLSVLFRSRPHELALLPLAAALAVCEACEQVAPVRCLIKWPNDVLIEGRKAAGILIESRPQEEWSVVGIGLNVNTAADELAPDLRDSAISLRIAAGRTIDRDETLAVLLERLAGWTRGAPRERVLAAYRERDALRGRRIRWSAGARELEGEAAGVDDDGNLVVFDGGGERRVLDAGEVHLQTPA